MRFQKQWPLAVLLAFAVLLELVGGCASKPSPPMMRQEGILFRSLIYWVTTGEMSRISRPEGVHVVGWTPDGGHLWWVSNADNGPAIWLSDPCGQSPPTKAFDPTAYPDFRFDRIAYGWLDDHTLFLNGQQRHTPEKREGVWRFDLRTGQLTLWQPGYAMDRAFSKHVALLWHPDEGFRLWAWGKFYSMPQGLPLRYDDTVHVSPDERWLLWREESGWYITPLDAEAGPRFDRRRNVPTEGQFVGWVSEGSLLIFYSTESLSNEQVRYVFYMIDPQERAVKRTVSFASPRIRTWPPFTLGPSGDRVALDAVDFQNPDHTYAYIEVWDLVSGERQRIYETPRGTLTVRDWALVDVGACLHAPQEVP